MSSITGIKTLRPNGLLHGTRRLCILSLLCLLPIALWAQTSHEPAIALPDKAFGADDCHDLKGVVITASRLPQAQDSVPVPVTVIGKKQIQQMGSRRLLEVLKEQTGFNFVTDEHGSGVQLQGMSPDYTMIMIDGQPLIGRTTGKFDLNRITVANIEQIEIIKGASSSLYGSEAMGGVINIITQSRSDTSVSLSAKYGGYGTLDLSGTGSYAFARQKGDLQLTADYYKTDGFAVAPDGSGYKNLPPYYSLTLHGKGNYKIADGSTLMLAARYGLRRQENKYDFVGTGPQADQSVEKDLNASASWKQRFSSRWESRLTYSLNHFVNDQGITRPGLEFKTDSTYFKQNMHRLEWQHQYKWEGNGPLTAGIGTDLEDLVATRYPGKKTMNSAFAFAQQQLFLFDKLNAIIGARADWNAIYGGQVNPKLALQYDLRPKIKLRASVGRGFKSPDFRQLYMVFTNPLVGYTVVGTEEVASELEKMKAEGSVKTIFPDAALAMKGLKAERSWSYNAGLGLAPCHSLRLNVNFFYNSISDQVLSVPIAEKLNNQQLFSYKNISRSFTAGWEGEVTWRIMNGLELFVGYQLLYAKDRDVIDSIRSGRYTLTNPVNGQTRKASPSDYYGLNLRSRHQANAKLVYQYKPWGLTFSARANYMDKSPFAAVSGNDFFSEYDRFTPAYIVLSGTVSKSFCNDKWAVQVAMDNCTDFRDPMLPGQMGRQLLAGLRWNWKAGEGK